MADDRRCRACRHWLPEDHSSAQDWGTCRLAETDGAGEAVGPGGLALALADPSGFGAVLLTAPDFGCVQWAARPDEAAAPERP